MNSSSRELPLKALYLMQQAPQANSFTGNSEDIVYACLNAAAEEVQRGNAIALPSGPFELWPLLQAARPGWIPDYIHVSSSLALTNPASTPTDISRFDCPTIMKMTDSHHTARPLQKLIDYGRAVNCRYHWTTYNRQHLHFYTEAGLANAFWMPGSISIAEQEIAPAAEKIYDVVFCGSLDDSGHPYRTRAVRFLQDAGINVHVARLPYLESLKVYSQAKIVFNCSLNGDLNRRVFETLMSGSFLLTDRLAPESGLPVLFREGEHLECYGSYSELLEKVRHYLANPDATEVIACRGQQHFQESYRPTALNEQLQHFVLQGKPLPEFCRASDDERIVKAHAGLNLAGKNKHSPRLETRIAVYEAVQELHRINTQVSLQCRSTLAPIWLSDLKDLPRLSILGAETTNADVILLDETQAWPEVEAQLRALKTPSRFSVLIFAGAAAKSTRTELERYLKRSDFVATSSLTQEAADCWVYQKRSQISRSMTSSDETIRLPYYHQPSPIWKRVAKRVLPPSVRETIQSRRSGR